MKNNKLISIIACILVMLSMTVFFSTVAFAEESAPTATQTEAIAEETAEDSSLGDKAMAAAIVVGVAAAAGAIAMGIAIAKSAESMARQPEASGKINSAMMLGLVFIETLIIYALIVAILIIFVL